MWTWNQTLAVMDVPHIASSKAYRVYDEMVRYDNMETYNVLVILYISFQYSSGQYSADPQQHIHTNVKVNCILKYVNIMILSVILI